MERSHHEHRIHGGDVPMPCGVDQIDDAKVYEAFADIMKSDMAVLDSLKSSLYALSHASLKEAMKTMCTFIYGRDGAADAEASRCMSIIASAKMSAPIDELVMNGAEDGLRVLEDIGIADDDGFEAWLDEGIFKAITRSAIMSKFFMLGPPASMLEAIMDRMPGDWRTSFDRLVVMSSRVDVSGIKMMPFALIHKGSRTACSATGFASKEGMSIVEGSFKDDGRGIEYGMVAYDIIESMYAEYALSISDLPSSEALPFAVRDEVAEKGMKGLISASYHLLHRVIDRSAWSKIPVNAFESYYGAPIMLATKDLSMVVTDHRVQAMYVNALKSGLDVGLSLFVPYCFDGGKQENDIMLCANDEGDAITMSSCKKETFVVMYDKKSKEPVIAMKSYALACPEPSYRKIVSGAISRKASFRDERRISMTLDDLIFVRFATKAGKVVWER